MPKFCVLWLVLSALPARAIDLAIEYPALQRILAEQMFTQDGRKYVRGSKANKCSYAYLENPRISALKGRLHVDTHFTGSSKAGFFGGCVGLGGAFDLTIAATPYYREDAIAFREVQVDTPGRDGFYIRGVRAALARSLSTQFAYRISEDAKRILEAPRDKAPYRQEMQSFRVVQVRVAPEALILTLDFTVRVK